MLPLFRIDTHDLWTVALANAIRIVCNEIANPEGHLNDERQSQNQSEFRAAPNSGNGTLIESHGVRVCSYFAALTLSLIDKGDICHARQSRKEPGPTGRTRTP